MMSANARRWALTELLRFAELLVRAGHRPSQQLEDLVVRLESPDDAAPPSVAQLFDDQ